MQGMMIQDFPTGPQGRKIPAAGESQEPVEQPFGQVLGSEAEKNVVKMENNSSEPMATEAEFPGETAGAPFFMTALFNESVPFVKVSENAELVAAAERTQELIGAWLQPEQEEMDEGGLEEIMTAALEALEALEPISPALEPSAQEELSQEQAISAEITQSILSQEEVAELKDLLAVMVQSGQVPTPLEGHPLVAELQKQLELVQPLATAKGSGGVRGKDVSLLANSPVEMLAGEAEPVSVAPENVPQPQASSGLQENQIARMLKPQHQQPALHGQPGLQVQAEPEVTQDFALNPDVEGELSSDIPPETAKAGVLPLNANIQTQPGIQVNTAPQRLEPLIESAAVKLIQLPSGQQLPESQLVDQIVTHLSGSVDGESGRMRLRLNPAELGSLRLDLVVEGDRVRAHLLAQSQQVQEVLDRHLPQLRDSLQQQGLKIDEFRVDVQTGKDQDSGQNFAWQQQQQKEHSPQSPWLNDDWPQQDVEIPLQQLLQEGNGGISLRV